MGVAICLCLFASPLAALKTVLSTKSAASIPLPLSLATTINCFLWTVVGVFDMHEPNIIIPNAIGLIFGLLQLVLKLVYSGVKVDRRRDLVLTRRKRLEKVRVVWDSP